MIFSPAHQFNDFEGCFNVHCSWLNTQRLFPVCAVRRIETVTGWSPLHIAVLEMVGGGMEMFGIELEC